MNLLHSYRQVYAMATLHEYTASAVQSTCSPQPPVELPVLQPVG